MGNDDPVKNKIDDTPERFTCSLCNVADIHVKDYTNHLNGKKHKFKVRHNELEAQDDDESHEETQENKENHEAIAEYSCDLCKTTFTDHGFYEIHIGTKRHRKKLKKSKMSKRKKAEEDNVRRTQIITSKKMRRLDVRNLIADAIAKPMREKYKVRSEDVHPKSYISSIAAYWAVYLALDDNVTDFKISINDKKWNSFGDISIQIFWKDTDVTYVIQFKQITDNHKSISSLTEGKFEIKRQIVGLSAIKHVDDLSKVKFVVFTTSTLDSTALNSVSLKCSVLPEKWKICNNISEEEESITLKIKPLNNKRKDILNTTDDNENIFLITLDKTYQLPRLYLYTNQKKFKSFGQDLDEIVRRKFGSRSELHKQFITYIENWSDGLLGGHFKLSKSDICLKITDLLLSPYTIEPPMGPTDLGESYQLWNKVLENVDVTIAKFTHPICWRFTKPINQLIENFFGVKIDTLTRSLHLKPSILSDIKNPKVKSYLFEETLSVVEEVSLKIFYLIFWKADLVPLILHVVDSFELDLIMKATSLTKDKRIIILSSFEINRYSLARSYKSFKFFSTLDDLKHLFDIILDNTLIRVNETYSVSLKTIYETDEYFLRTVTPDVFFDMCLNRYSFKIGDVYSNHKSSEDVKLILSDEVMEELYTKLVQNTTDGDVLLRSTITDNGWLRNINPQLL